MESRVLLAVSLFVALLLGFTVSSVITPDPTGLLPVAMGVVLTGVSSPVFCVGIQRVTPRSESST
jgi:hypothetical protein